MSRQRSEWCQQCRPHCFCTCFSSPLNAVEGCRWPGPMRMTRCLGNKKKSKLAAKLTLSVLFCIIFLLSLQQSSICHNAFSLCHAVLRPPGPVTVSLGYALICECPLCINISLCSVLGIWRDDLFSRLLLFLIDFFASL